MIWYNPKRKNNLIDKHASKEAKKLLNESFKAFQDTHAQALNNVFQYLINQDFDNAIQLLTAMEISLKNYREFAEQQKKEIDALR